MSAKTATISAHWVYDPAQSAAGIQLDTPAWRAWLEAETTTRFAYPVFDPAHGYVAGFMTVRKEQRQRGGTYWVAYRRCHGRLRKVYLGRAHTLTQARLETIAQAFRVANAAPGA
jgi:LuxR family maltose regulon positive regulatory protein